MSNVGRLIHLTRTLTGATVSEIASVIGRSEGHLQHIENGMLTGTPETLLAIADQLDISPSRLRDAYVQDALEAAAMLWESRTKCQYNVKRYDRNGRGKVLQ
jgi:transcriptional regulator with XRE-family HTH domain